MISEPDLTPAETRLVTAIVELGSPTQEDIAARLKLTARHVRRLMARESVRNALDIAARAGLREATSILGRGSARAARAMDKMAAGELSPHTGRVAACRAVLEGAGRLIDLVDLERRIAGLEKARSPSPGWGESQ